MASDSTTSRIDPDLELQLRLALERAEKKAEALQNALDLAYDVLNDLPRLTEKWREEKQTQVYYGLNTALQILKKYAQKNDDPT